MNPLNYVCFQHPIKVVIFFQCVLLIKLNAYEDEWFLATKTLQEENRKA